MSTQIGTQAWKKTIRLSAIERRAQMDPARKRERDASIEQHLEAAFLNVLSVCVVAFCWPYKREVDLRSLMQKLRDRGAQTALPIVVKRAQPMIFRSWWPDVAMAAGVYDIPVPQDTPQVEPDIVFAPVNAFDDSGFRLGYGGGFFDRTLAAIDPRPIAIGIAYEEQRIPTIHPTEHDIPMDFIVTEACIYRRLEECIAPVPRDECADAVTKLMSGRRLRREACNRK